MMLILNIKSCKTAKAIKRANIAFGKMLKRNVLSFLSERRLREMSYTEAGKADQLEKLSDQCELDMPDRRELDDAVLEMLGVRSKKRRDELIDALYEYLRDFFELTRQKEEKAIANKKKAKRRGPARPSEVAAQIYQEIEDKEAHLLRQYDPDFIDKAKPFDTFDLPSEGMPKQQESLFAAHGVAFVKGRKTIDLVEAKTKAQVRLIILVAGSGVRGLVRVPHDEDECRRLFHHYEDFVLRRRNRVREMIEDRTADEDMQMKVYEALMPMLVRRC